MHRYAMTVCPYFPVPGYRDPWNRIARDPISTMASARPETGPINIRIRTDAAWHDWVCVDIDLCRIVPIDTASTVADGFLDVSPYSPRERPIMDILFHCHDKCRRPSRTGPGW
jgi:hypothetical protein